MNSIAVIGGGSWATALVKVLTENNIHVNWWMRDEENIKFIRKHSFNGKYLRVVHLNLGKIDLSSDINETCKKSDAILFVVPSAFIKSVIQDIEPECIRHKSVLSAVKGVDPETHLPVIEFLTNEFSLNPENTAAIVGPSHAEEIAMERSSYITIATPNHELWKELSPAFNNEYVFTRYLRDVAGVEYSSVLKNIYAIAVGIATGLGLGDNFIAVLVTSAASEIEYFLSQISPKERNLFHSAYIGDLLVTCYSVHSRNRTFGNMVGHGYSVRSAQLEMNMIAEGYYASKSIWKMCQSKEIEMPIADAVYRILYEKVSPIFEFNLLMPKLSL